MNIHPPRDLTQPTAEFRRQIAADAEALVPVRRALTCWVKNLGVDSETCEDMVLAAYEAMANAAEHAYRDTPGGVFDVCAAYFDQVITITVTDNGTWKPPTNDPDTAPSFRGRGLAMINDLAATTVLTNKGHGTTITMTWNV